MKTVNYVASSPGFRYADARAAIDWLQRAFGFEPGAVVEDGGKVVHAELWAGDLSVGVASANPGDPLGRITPKDAGGVTTLVYFVVDDVDRHYQRALAAGAKILVEPEDRDYGGRDYACADPEGYVWSFGTYRPSRPPADR